jgi:hypothetical protein
MLNNITPCTTNTSLIVELPNGAIIQSTETGSLPTLAGIDIPAYIFSDADLKQTLLSLSALTNRGCTVELTKTEITIYYKNKVILHGSKLPTDRLWTIDMCPANITPDPHRARKARRLNTEAAQNTGAALLTVHLDTDA